MLGRLLTTFIEFDVAFQRVGLMRQRESKENKLNSTADIRKAFAIYNEIEKNLEDSLQPLVNAL